MIRRILLPLDGSLRAESVVPEVLRLARAFEAEVVLLRVAERPEGSRSPWTDPAEWRLARSESVRYLEGVAERFRQAGVPVDLDVSVGRPADEIVETARSRRADLVALTSHGEGGASAAPLGSTAQKVVKASEVSILVHPTLDHERGRPPSAVPPPTAGPKAEVLVPLDGSSRAEWALCLALSVARAAGTDLLLLHVVAEPEVLAGEGDERARDLARAYVSAAIGSARSYLTSLIGRLNVPDMVVHALVISDTSPEQAIQRVAEEREVSLVVLSAHGRSAREGLHGTMASALLHGLTRPVLVFQDAPGGSAERDTPPARARALPTRSPSRTPAVP